MNHPFKPRKTCYSFALGALDICLPAAIVNVDGTVSRIDAGLNVGAWTVAGVKTGNPVELSLEGLEKFDEAELMAKGRESMAVGKPHYTVDRIGELLLVSEDIERLLAAG